VLETGSEKREKRQDVIRWRHTRKISRVTEKSPGSWAVGVHRAELRGVHAMERNSPSRRYRPSKRSVCVQEIRLRVVEVARDQSPESSTGSQNRLAIGRRSIVRAGPRRQKGVQGALKRCCRYWASCRARARSRVHFCRYVSRRRGWVALLGWDRHKILWSENL